MSYSIRSPTGETDDSDADAANPKSKAMPTFGQSTKWLDEWKEAAADPDRTLLPSEVEHPPKIPSTITRATDKLLKQFIDEMFRALQKPYTTSNKSSIFIKADKTIVQNIGVAFAQADLLDLTLARGTRGYYIERDQTLTITTPTGFPRKPPFKDAGGVHHIYLTQHRTDWSNIPMILKDQLCRPASWGRDERGIPKQFPSYGFFGYAAEMNGHDLEAYAVTLTSANLNKIGKGLGPSGILGVIQGPQICKMEAGGNDALQRACKYHGISRGKDGACATNSAHSTVSYVMANHSFPTSDVTWASKSTADQKWLERNVSQDHSKSR